MYSSLSGVIICDSLCENQPYSPLEYKAAFRREGPRAPFYA